MIRTLLFAAILSVALHTGASAQTVIHAGKLINGQDGKVYNEMTIVVEDGKVKTIEDGYADPDKFGDADSVTAIDLKEHTVMPGLMDMHTHLMMQHHKKVCLLYTSPSPRDQRGSRMPSSA